MGIPELKSAVIGNCYNLSIIDFDHLVDAGLVFFNTLHWCKFYALVSMLHTKFVIFDLGLDLAEEVDRAATQLGHHTVDDVLARVVAQNLYLQVKVIFLMFL